MEDLAQFIGLDLPLRLCDLALPSTLRPEGCWLNCSPSPSPNPSPSPSSSPSSSPKRSPSPSPNQVRTVARVHARPRQQHRSSRHQPQAEKKPTGQKSTAQS